jgi:2-oxoglutarate/2-oxoacid ferredoxin oxidoreductase subunit beta
LTDEKLVFERPAALSPLPTHYCPGCTHGVIHRLVAETIDELNILERTIGVAPVGCAVLIRDYLGCDFIEAAHGRAPAIATGLKRSLPNAVVFTYQGDGDLAAIGTSEIVHAAARGENITVVFVNNAIYGMTGGQMAPTTLLGQRTTSTPLGRDASLAGNPVHVSEMLATQAGSAYIARTSVHNPANVAKAKKAIKTAFQTQIDGSGFALVEILSSCPTNWRMTPVESLVWIEQHMVPVFPLGVFRQIASAQVA